MGEHDDRQQRVSEIFGGVMERDAAAELASLLVPLPWEDLARRSDVEHLRSEMATFGSDIRLEMASLGSDIRSEMRGELVGFRGELRNEMADVRKEVADLRKEVGDLRLEVHEGLAAVRGQLPKLITANIASMVGLAALVVGAGAL